MADEKLRQYFQQWYQSELGKNLLEQETKRLQDLIAHDVGYYFLIQSPLKHLDLPNSLLRTQMMLAPVLEMGAPDNMIVANAKELPIDSEGIDVHILHHTLELSETPHDDLREAARSLLPSGKLIIVGFNPWSIWGVRRIFPIKAQAPWKAHFIAEHRLEDWLKVAGLALQSTDYFCYSPPVQSPYWINKFNRIDEFLSPLKLPFGGVYIITATKYTPKLVNRKAKWKRKAIPVSPLTKPAVKEIQD